MRDFAKLLGRSLSKIFYGTGFAHKLQNLEIMVSKIETMNSVLNKMEDIKNTQQSLIEKLGQVQVDLFEIQSEELDKELEKVHQSSADSLDIITNAIENFEIKRNKIEQGV